MLVLLVNSPNFSITHDSDNDWLYVQWQGLQTSASSAEGCLLILQWVEATDATKILCDSSDAIDGWDELMEWVTQDFLPHIAAAGICSIGWINSQDLITKIEITLMLQQSTTPFVAVFDDSASAYYWLQKATYRC